MASDKVDKKAPSDPEAKDDEMDDLFHNNADRLYKIFHSMNRDAFELTNKEKPEANNEFYNSTAILRYNLEVYSMFIGLYYPLCKTQYSLASTNSSIDPIVLKNMVNYTDINLRTSFVTMCGFQFEKILKTIVRRHCLDIKKGPVICRFKKLSEYFDVNPDETFNLAKVFYKTRNTLHNGGIVNSNETLEYNSREFRFEINEPMRHVRWGWLVFFASEFIRVFIDIADSEKFKKYQASGI
ncbi:MAG: hypothetical protein MPK75_05300 [Alphaproteobacteria bacterium]|nr:hypothetical protein [Alphaproteobacteria bacterium]